MCHLQAAHLAQQSNKQLSESSVMLMVYLRILYFFFYSINLYNSFYVLPHLFDVNSSHVCEHIFYGLLVSMHPPEV